LFAFFGMDIRYIRKTKPNKTKRQPTTAAFLVLGLLSVLSTFVFREVSQLSRSDDSSSNVPTTGSTSWPLNWNWNDAGSSPAAALNAEHPVYPYSVIPGGAHSSRELIEAVKREPVVASHYAEFAVGNARVIGIARDTQVYVSYRLGNQIYWTKKRVTLHKGETLLSDGKYLARTRCGNRISEIPTDPTSPSEPEEKVLNHPLPPRIPETTTDSPLPWPIWPSGSAPLLFMPDTPGGRVPGLPFLPLIPCCGSSTGPSQSPSPGPLPQPYPPPVVATPEPTSLVLLTIGFAFLLLFWTFRQPCLIFLSSSLRKRSTRS
jgi:hypothetical protein